MLCSYIKEVKLIMYWNYSFDLQLIKLFIEVIFEMNYISKNTSKALNQFNYLVCVMYEDGKSYEMDL